MNKSMCNHSSNVEVRFRKWFELYCAQSYMTRLTHSLLCFRSMDVPHVTLLPLGIIEALRILKLGYPTRCTYEKIFGRYGKILVPTPPNLNKRDFVEAVLNCVGETLDPSQVMKKQKECQTKSSKAWGILTHPQHFHA